MLTKLLSLPIYLFVCLLGFPHSSSMGRLFLQFDCACGLWTVKLNDPMRCVREDNETIFESSSLLLSFFQTDASDLVIETLRATGSSPPGG